MGLKEALLAKRFKIEEIPIDGVGVIKVRALSRDEMLGVDSEQPALKIERFVLSRTMVDPEMSEQDIADWQAASGAGEIGKVMDKVYEMSGIARGQAKEQYKSVRE